ncbi:MAG: tRNA pseudouridine(55) synthase TruB [Bdellovibrionota bacterium]
MEAGFFLVDKEKGVSSASVVASLKKKFNLKKVGHTGTLDPFATGLLVCPFNGATRLSSFVQETKKIYSGIILLGTKTDSDDITGNIIERKEVESFSLEELLKVRDLFLGKITQVPPKLSAIKIDGKRAYDKFRHNEDFEMREREVFIESFDIVDFLREEIFFKIVCSKGTYIRALARDFGEKLNTPSTLKELKREALGGFNISDAKKVNNLEFSDMLSWERIFSADCRLYLDDASIERLNVGDSVFLNNLQGSKEYKDKFLSRTILYYKANKANQTSGVLIKKSGSWSFLVNGI